MKIKNLNKIKKTRLYRALAKVKSLVALMLDESIEPKVILSDSIKKARLSDSLMKGDDEMERDLPLTVEEAAKILKVSKYTLYELVKQGVIPSRRVGRQIRIDPENLNQYVRGSLPLAAAAPFASTREPLSVKSLSSPEPSSLENSPVSQIQAIPKETFQFVGSHDPVLELLADFWKHSSAPQSLSLDFKGSMDGLIALYRRQAELSGIHLWDEQSKEYNLPFVHYVLTGESVVLINLVQRAQGFIVPAGNPFELQSWEDLTRKDLRFINRQKGSGTRIRLDTYLRSAGISPALITGYEEEETTHFGVASAVANDQADFGIGVQAAAHRMGLDFIPLFSERYDLVALMETTQSEAWQHLLTILNSSAFHLAIERQLGYDTSLTGKTIFQSESSPFNKTSLKTKRK